MRLPGHETHHLEFCETCAVFDQVHAERDDLTLRLGQVEAMGAELAHQAYAFMVALNQVVAHLGPTVHAHGCEGCEVEMAEALRLASEALSTAPARDRFTWQAGDVTVDE